jgi:ABC-type transport system involved in multi-copper enzyme maturation permease subunit
MSQAPTSADRNPSTGSLFQILLTAQVRTLLRSRKTIALIVVQLIPAIAALVYVIFENVDGLTMFRNIVENVTFPFLIPLAALFYGGPTIVDEMEGRTLTYLTLRPIPKTALFLGKLVAGWVVGCLVVIVPMFVLFLVSLATSDDMGATIGSMGQLSLAAGLGVITYASIFALLGAMFTTSLISGIIYFVVFEMIFAALPVLELLSVRYHLRTIAEFNTSDRLGLLDQLILDKPLVLPLWAGILIVLVLTLGTAAAGAYTFQEKEYRV